MGHRIIRLDPFGVCGPGSDTLNPLDPMFINPQADDFLDQVRDLSHQLIIRSPDAKEPFWDDAAEQVVSGFCSYVAGCESKPEKRNLSLVRKMTSTRDKFTQADRRDAKDGRAARASLPGSAAS